MHFDVNVGAPIGTHALHVFPYYVPSMNCRHVRPRTVALCGPLPVIAPPPIREMAFEARRPRIVARAVVWMVKVTATAIQGRYRRGRCSNHSRHRCVYVCGVVCAIDVLLVSCGLTSGCKLVRTGFVVSCGYRVAQASAEVELRADIIHERSEAIKGVRHCAR